MAYRSLGAPATLHHGDTESPETAADGLDQDRFDPLELRVIALAEADPVASIGPPTRFRRFFERWFGFKLPHPLANERLEALRRFAVLSRVSDGRLPAEEVKTFLNAGFSLLQARAVQRRAAAR
ncbi:MAG TPA: hypothetical protein VEC11_09590 [Allosphingosinicella sp.]|nr:hypothetical protein [Allosphingosinicella sp.]